jgi:hypothetical protein
VRYQVYGIWDVIADEKSDGSQCFIGLEERAVMKITMVENKHPPCKVDIAAIKPATGE